MNGVKVYFWRRKFDVCRNCFVLQNALFVYKTDFLLNFRWFQKKVW